MAQMICDQCNQGVLKFEEVVVFMVEGTPIAQPRVAARAVVPRNGKPFAQVYTPGGEKSPVRFWKIAVQAASLPHRPPRPFEGPVFLSIDFYFPRPKYMSAKKYERGPIPHTALPDRDNCEKAVMDALQGIYFQNDSQVCSGGVRKFYGGAEDKPHALITVGVLKKDRRADSTARGVSPDGEKDRSLIRQGGYRHGR